MKWLSLQIHWRHIFADIKDLSKINDQIKKKIASNNQELIYTYNLIVHLNR